MGMRTITLKLHKPSKRKQEIIEKAMVNYTAGFRFLLDRAWEQLRTIEDKFREERGGYRAARISKWVDASLGKELNRFGIEPFKDSLKMDFGMVMAGYLNLKSIQQNVSFPAISLNSRESDEAYEEIHSWLMDGKMTLQEYIRRLDWIERKRNCQKPIFFCRYAPNRDYCLLYDAQKKRYYAKLYLMNAKDGQRKRLESSTGKELLYIHESGKTFVPGVRAERFILVPLAFGKFQEQYLLKALENPGILKTARLYKRSGEYYLSVSVDLGTPERLSVKAHLGVARGLDHVLNYTVCDGSGFIVAQGSLELPGRTAGKPTDFSVHEIHILANQVADLAEKYKAQTVLCKFDDKSDRIRWHRRDLPLMGCKDYNTLGRLLAYKLEGRGLPPPILVSPVGIFYTCPRCGTHCKANRFSRDLFICTACGHAANIEQVGGENLARRLMKYNGTLFDIKVQRLGERLQFSSSALGMSFYTGNSPQCMEELASELKRLADCYCSQRYEMEKSSKLKSRYYLMKKLSMQKDILKAIKIV